ncbi:MAG: alpha/beta hydrolase [Verrucomicrobia bacterium]|nr:alpha/beta hydrolase [Verrucomicrobiota bacterium]
MSKSGFVHVYVPGATPDAPALLLLHGTGGNENDLVPLGQQLFPGASLLSPRGKVSEQGMPRFFRRIAEGVFDLEDLIARTHELGDFVDEFKTDHEQSRIIAVGYSNGANIAAGMLLLRPTTLAGAVLFRAMVPLVPEKLPDLREIRVFLASGGRDPLIGPQAASDLRQLLERCGALVSHRWIEGGHQLTQEDLSAARQWLAKEFR